MSFGCANSVGSAQGKPIHIGAIEGWRIDGSHYISAQHAAKRVHERYAFGGQRPQIQVALESRLRLLRRDDLQELLLAGGGTHPRNEVAFATQPRF